MKYIFLFLSCFAFSKSQSVKNYSWNGVDVVYLEDEKFPTYSVNIYFADGALADAGKDGKVSSMLGLLSKGTSKFDQKQIANQLDFFGTSISHNITHEYSTVSYGGLVKDSTAVTNLFCHMMKDANYPDKELGAFKKKVESRFNNLVANPRGLADRVFRNLSLKGSPFASFVNGKKSSIASLDKAELIEARKYFNNKVYKKIFISGPKTVLGIKNSFINECGWNNKATFKRTENVASLDKKVSPNKKPVLYFASFPGANQAQIRMGGAPGINYFKNTQYDLTKLMSTILGGSFTSMLMQELRVKKGLTYGAYAYAAPQAKYARSVVTTSTKNQTVVEALKTIKDTIGSLTSNKFDQTRVESVKKFLKGKHLLKFESNSSYISNLILYDHIKKDLSDLYNFSSIVDKFTVDQVVSQAKDIFGWGNQMAFVLGDSSVLSKIKAMNEFEIKEVNIKDYL